MKKGRYMRYTSAYFKQQGSIGGKTASENMTQEEKIKRAKKAVKQREINRKNKLKNS